MLNLEVEVAAAALDEGDVAIDLAIVDQRFAGIRRCSRAAGIVVIIGEYQLCLDRIAVSQGRREIGLLDGILARGDPIVPRLGPSLPATTTARTPALVAFISAISSGALICSIELPTE